MYYNERELLDFKNSMDKLEYEVLKDIWWSAFDKIQGISFDGADSSNLDDLYYIKDEAYRQREKRFKNEFKSEFKSWAIKEEESFEEEFDEYY